MGEELTIATVAGAVAPWVVAVLRSPGMRPWVVRVIAIALPAALTVLGVGMSQGWTGTREVAAFVMVSVGVMQTVYTAFKDAGVDALDALTTGPTKGKHTLE